MTEDFLYSFVSNLEIVILKYLGPRKYEAVGIIPDFYTRLYPPENGTPCTEPWKHSEFLDFYVGDAENFFEDGGETGTTPASIWQENGVEGDEALMAQAMLLKGEKLVIIRRLGEEYVEKVRVLRKARENLLEIRQLALKMERYKHVSQYDSMTGLFNRATFTELMDYEIERSAKTRVNLSLLILDIDNFKQVNDIYGHLAGDKVLTALGKILASNLRAGDIAARYGGEEFAILAPNTNDKQLALVAEKIRAAVDNYTFELPQHITVSVGGTLLKYPEKSDIFFDRADMALYDAKHDNKNNVKIRY